MSITGNVNVTREETFYTRTGDWFPWLSIAMFVILLPLSAAHAHLVTTEKDANERLQKWLPLLQTKDIEDTEPLLETWLEPN